MKRYGLIVADNGADMFITGAYDPHWNNDVLNPAFGALTASDFDVIALGHRLEHFRFRGSHAPNPVLVPRLRRMPRTSAIRAAGATFET